MLGGFGVGVLGCLLCILHVFLFFFLGGGGGGGGDFRVSMLPPMYMESSDV